MMTLSAHAALWLLIFSAPISVYIAYTDIKSMRIPNTAVLALLAVFAVVGFIVLPTSTWAWAWLNFAVVLAVGFVMTVIGGFGAGDAKFAAAMAPFIAIGDLRQFCVLLSAVTIAAFIAHRGLRAIPAVRRATPDWASWEHKGFPFGLALGPSLAFYLALAAQYGS